MHEHGFQKLRKSMGLTQAQMAGLIRVPVVTVRAWEAGTLEIKSKRLIRRRPAILRVASLDRARQASGRVHGPSVSKRETRRSSPNVLVTELVDDR
jgi:DNA-binding XRE family transcriptional regulator